MQNLKTILFCAGAAVAMFSACKSGEAPAQLTQSGLDAANFDTIIGGKKVALYTLKNANGMEVCITNYGGRVVSLVVPDKDEEPRIMREVMKECDANRWHPYFADCIAKGTNKATGIDDICKYYGIDISETMAFRDGGNDIAMIKYDGVGVAMGNALEYVTVCVARGKGLMCIFTLKTSSNIQIVRGK